ncbi:MAG TPA: hypothetical protein EYN03_01555 [Planctomycetes bacterium]|nr:hypothetical protein [Planctomycetaceae bacterium]HIN94304.1 hypothetical protein [Planctomycetota bacterium]
MSYVFFRRSLLAMVTIALFCGGLSRPLASSYGADDPPGKSIADKLGLPTFAGPGGKPVKVSATFYVPPGKRRGKLYVTAKIAPQNHLYSVTQKPGGPLPTKIRLNSPTKVKLVGPWTPDKKPKVKASDVFDVPVEEHHGTVTWTAPLEIPAGVDAKTLKLQVKIDGQVCTDDLLSCMEVKESLTANFQAPKKPARKASPAATNRSLSAANTLVAARSVAQDPFAEVAGSFQDKTGNVSLEGQASSSVVAAGDSVALSLTVIPTPPYHVYDYAATDPNTGIKPTLLVVQAPKGWQVVGPETDGAPVVKEDPSGLPLIYYEEPVTWILTVTVPPGTAEGEYDLAGGVAYQVCKDDTCDPPTGVDYRLRITVAAETRPEAVALTLTEGSYAKLAQQAQAMAGSVSGNETETQVAPPNSTGESAAGTGFQIDQLKVAGGPDDSSLLAVLLIAFAAGFILNFMPCVLPVIGLKIVSFVQQAGESRQRVFMLNLWFSIGLISVFMVLAVMAKVMGLGWGDQFRSLPFNVVLTAIVFVFALSFLGVWEIPIPGFVASGKASEVADQEGPAGAFCKGVLTTVLATPCSGPLLVPALTWAVAQPALVTYLGFLCVGLGMAFPYLVIGANPQLIRFLPKPGAWMETFKNIMGFVLLATVVFLMTIVSSISVPAVLPVFTLLIGLWAACWWIGRTPLTAEFSDQAKAWFGGAIVAACSGWIAFGFVNNMMSARYEGQAARDVAQFKRVAAQQAKDNKHNAEEIEWLPFSTDLLEELTQQGNTVFIDFTADW